LAANKAFLKTTISAIRKGNTPNDVDAILRQNGINFEFTTTRPNNQGDPAFNLKVNGLPIQIRLHLNSDGSINQFRFGVNLFRGTPENPQSVNPADLPYLKAIDDGLIWLFRKPTNNDPLPAGSPWKGEFIDYYGDVYLDFMGNLGGLRSDPVHFGPIK
jgi:hypothetical protein